MLSRRLQSTPPDITSRTTTPNGVVADLEAKAWSQWYEAPAALGETAATLQRIAQEASDARIECLGLFFAARPLVVERADIDAHRALDHAEIRCLETGQHRVLRLVTDLRAQLYLRRGQIEEAWQLAHADEQRCAAGRDIVDQILNAIVLAEIAMQRTGFDEALEQGYRAVQFAEQLGVPSFVAIARHNLAADQLSLLNLEDALPMQLTAEKLVQQVGMHYVLPYVWNNLILIYDIQGRYDVAARVLSKWEAQDQGFSDEDRRHRGVTIALGLLALGRKAEALEVATIAQSAPGKDQALTSAAIWARGRALLSLGRADQARAVCEQHLSALGQSKIPTTPYNLVRLQEVISAAAEEEGDFRAALQAQKAAHQAALSMLGNSARARYVSLKIQQAQSGDGDRDLGRDQARLTTLNRSLTDFDESLRNDEAPKIDMAEQRRFVAYISHEIRGALNGVMGMNSLLMMSKLDDRQSRYVNLAQSSAKTVLALVNDILDIAKLEADRFDIGSRPVAIAELAQQVTDEFENQAREKKIRLSCEVSPNLPPMLTDALRLKQILTNLLSNAIKFTDHGTVCLKVRHEDTSSALLQTLHFAVIDTGVGISDEDLPKLFSEFSRAGTDLQPRSGGTGLGLALSRKLLRRMGSELHVQSQTGQGSTFWFKLRLPLANDPVA